MDRQSLGQRSSSMAHQSRKRTADVLNESEDDHEAPQRSTNPSKRRGQASTKAPTKHKMTTIRYSEEVAKQAMRKEIVHTPALVDLHNEILRTVTTTRQTEGLLLGANTYHSTTKSVLRNKGQAEIVDVNRYLTAEIFIRTDNWAAKPLADWFNMVHEARLEKQFRNKYWAANQRANKESIPHLFRKIRRPFIRSNPGLADEYWADAKRIMRRSVWVPGPEHPIIRSAVAIMACADEDPKYKETQEHITQVWIAWCLLQGDSCIETSYLASMIYDRANKNTAVATCFSHEFADLRRAKIAHSDFSQYSKWLQMHGRCHIITFDELMERQIVVSRDGGVQYPTNNTRQSGKNTTKTVRTKNQTADNEQGNNNQAGTRKSLTNQGRTTEELFESLAISRPQQQGRLHEETRSATNNYNSNQQKKKKAAYGTEAGSSVNFDGPTTRAQPIIPKPPAPKPSPFTSAASTSPVPISQAQISTAKRHSARNSSATTPSAEDIAPSASTGTTALAAIASIATAPNPVVATMASSDSNTTRPMTPADVKDMVNEMMKSRNVVTEATVEGIIDRKLAPVLEAVAEAKGDLKKASDALQDMEKKWLAMELRQKEVSDTVNRLYQKQFSIDKTVAATEKALTPIENALSARKTDVREAIKGFKGDIKAVNYKQEVLEEEQEYIHETVKAEMKQIMDDIRAIKEKQEAYEKSLAAAMSELHEKTLSSFRSSNGEKSADSITCAPYAPTSKKGPSTRNK